MVLKSEPSKEIKGEESPMRSLSYADSDERPRKKSP